jgi:hypothetical protein
MGILGCSPDRMVDGAGWQMDFEVADGDYLLPRLSPD